MEIKEIKNINELLLGSKYISKGTTCKCYWLKDNTLLKLYRDSDRKRKLFKERNMFEHLEFLSDMNNDSFTGPSIIYVHNNEIIGYGMRFIKGKTLHHIPNKITIDDIIKWLEIVLVDTKEVSDKQLRLVDLHDKNIIVNDRLNVIDLDHCFKRDYSAINLFNYNSNDIIETVLETIFKVKYNYSFDFYSEELNHLHKKRILNESYKELLIKLKEQLGNETNVKDLRSNRKKLIYTTDISDYRGLY